MRWHLRVVILVLVFAGLAGCQTPLARYILEHDYEPFAVPRDSDGVGTVIAFADGREVTIARPDECLGPVAARAEASPRQVALADYDYTISRNDTLELALPEALQPGLRLEAAATGERVKTIRIRLIEPFELVASVKSVADALPTLQGTCRPLVLDERHFVISQVLGARGIEYEFLDAGGNALTLDAALLERINAGAGLRRRYQGRRALSVDFPIYIGYRLLRATELPGLDERYVCNPVPRREIRALKTPDAG